MAEKICTAFWGVFVRAGQWCMYPYFYHLNHLSVLVRMCLDCCSTVPRAVPASSPLPVWDCATNAKGNPLWHRQTLVRTHCKHCWYIICAGTELAQTLPLLHVSLHSVLWRHNLAAFCEMGSLWRQMTRRCSAEYRGDELGRAAYVSPTAVCGFCTCLLTPVCSVLRFHSPLSFIQPLQRKWRGMSATHASPLWNLK